MKTKPTIKQGVRVRLRAIAPCSDFPEGLREERGRVVSVEDCAGMLIVLVDSRYRQGPDDDGLRECELTQAEVL
jgi:hypothetical protein